MSVPAVYLEKPEVSYTFFSNKERLGLQVAVLEIGM